MIEKRDLKLRNDGSAFVPSLEDAVLEATINSTGCFHHYSGNDIAIGHDEGGDRYTIWLIGEGDTNIQIGSVSDRLAWANLISSIKQLIYCVTTN